SAIGKAMNDDFDEVVDNTKMRTKNGVIIRHKDKKLIEDSVLMVQNSFFSMFSYSLLAGDKRSVLKDPYTVVLSERLARKVFDYRGNDFSQFVGKTLTIQRDSMPYRIDGICKNVPQNSHLQFNLLTSFITIVKDWPEAEYNFTHSDF